MRLRACVGARGSDDFAGIRVHVEMSLRGTFDAVYGVQTRVEPLGGIRRGHLPGEHRAGLVVKRATVLLRVEPSFPGAPFQPCIREPVEYLTGVVFRTGNGGGAGYLSLLFRNEGFPGTFPVFRNARFAEVFLGDDIRGDLAPTGRYDYAVHVEDDFSVEIAQFGNPPFPGYSFVRASAFPREPARHFHLVLL